MDQDSTDVPKTIDEVVRCLTKQLERDPNSELSMYGQLAPVYDYLFGSAYNYELQGDYVKQAASKEGSSRLLEAGCGTGRLLVELAEVVPEAQLYGVDTAEDMVQLARQRTQDLEEVKLSCNDILAVDGEYDTIVAFNLLPHFDPETVQSFFERSSSLLANGGSLVFDYKAPENNSNGTFDLWERESDEFCIMARFVTVYDEKQPYYAVSYEFTNKNNGKSYQTGELMPVYFQTPDLLMKQLRSVGFCNIDVYRDKGDQSGIFIATH